MCNAGFTRWVCAKFSQGGDPTHELDFFVSYDGDIPEVKFAEADDGWELYSEVLVDGVPTGPADLGDVLLASDVSPNNGIFKLKIRNGAAAGAKNVTSLVLDSTDVNWTGHSSILAGTVIDGVISGALEVIERSGAGGEIAGLTVHGPPLAGVAVVGPIDARRVTGTNLINGSVTNKITIAILDGVSLTIGGAIPGGLEITEKLEEAILIVNGAVPQGATVTIADMIGQAQANASLRFGGSFAGDLILTKGIDDAHTVVGLTGDFSGTIDLTTDDIAGQLNLVNGDGDVLNGGSILNGAIFYPSQFDAANSYDGTATFTSVAAGGEIESKQGAHIGGTIRVTGDVAGEVIILSGTLKPLGLIQIDGNLTGEVHIGSDCFGDIIIGGALKSAGFAGAGRILVDGVCDGDIIIQKQTDDLTLIHLLGGLDDLGSIEINKSRGNYNAGGDIQVGPIVPPMPLNNIIFDGCIHIYDNNEVILEYGDLNGDITTVGCHATGAALDICIDGNVNGTVSIKNSGCDPNVTTWSCPQGGCP